VTCRSAVSVPYTTLFRSALCWRLWRARGGFALRAWGFARGLLGGLRAGLFRLGGGLVVAGVDVSRVHVAGVGCAGVRIALVLAGGGCRRAGRGDRAGGGLVGLRGGLRLAHEEDPEGDGG